MDVSYFGVLISNGTTHFTICMDGAKHFLLFMYDHSTANVSILPTVAGDLNCDRKTERAGLSRLCEKSNLAQEIASYMYKISLRPRLVIIKLATF